MGLDIAKKYLIHPTRLICGWCRKEIRVNTQKDEHDEFPIIICYHCGRTLPSSRKISTGNLVGARHFHIPYKSGDIAG